MTVKEKTDFHTIQADFDLLKFVMNGKVDHWKAWSEAVDINNHSQFAGQLFPSLYLQLSKQGIDHPWISRLKGVYRRQWTRQKVMFENINSAFRLLDKHEIEYIEPFEQQLSRIVDNTTVLTSTVPRITLRSGKGPTAINIFLNEGWQITRVHQNKGKSNGILNAIEWSVSNTRVENLILTERYQPWHSTKYFRDQIWLRTKVCEQKRNRRTLDLSDFFCATILLNPRRNQAINWAPILFEVANELSNRNTESDLAIPDEKILSILDSRIKYISEISPALANLLRKISDIPIYIDHEPANNGSKKPNINSCIPFVGQYERWGGIRNIYRYLNSTPKTVH